MTCILYFLTNLFVLSPRGRGAVLGVLEPLRPVSDVAIVAPSRAQHLRVAATTLGLCNNDATVRWKVPTCTPHRSGANQACS